MESNELQIENMKTQIESIGAVAGLLALGWNIINAFVKSDYAISLERSIEGEIVYLRGIPHIKIKISLKNNGFRKAKVKKEATCLNVSSVTVQTLNLPDDLNTLESVRILENHKIQRGEPVTEEYWIPIPDDQSLLFIIEMFVVVGKQEWNDKKVIKW